LPPEKPADIELSCKPPGWSKSSECSKISSKKPRSRRHHPRESNLKMSALARLCFVPIHFAGVFKNLSGQLNEQASKIIVLLAVSPARQFEHALGALSSEAQLSC
jgi:hypothetical protein